MTTEHPASPLQDQLIRHLSEMKLVVAIDGPAASGKSTAGRKLASRLEYMYINSGSMYRAAASIILDREIPLDDSGAVADAVSRMDIGFVPSTRGGDSRVTVDKQDVTDAIGTALIGNAASDISAISGVRKHLVRLQQGMGVGGRVVMDGRDIGTKVFPRADHKFYLIAALEVRGQRRWEELSLRGTAPPLESVKDQLDRRDRNDQNREDSPLVMADDAILIDSSSLSAEDVVLLMIELMVKKHFP